VSIDIIATQGSTLGKINVTVDGRPDVSNRQLSFTPSTDYYIGGYYFDVFLDFECAFIQFFSILIALPAEANIFANLYS